MRQGAPRITGYGFVTPLGNAIAEFDDALFSGKSAVKSHTLDLPGLDRAELGIARCDFNEAAAAPPSRVPADRGTAMALVAARAAAAMAKLDKDTCEPTRVGVFWGSGMAGALTFDATCHTVHVQQRRMRPTTVVSTMPNAAAGELALLFGAQGSCLTYACACASSAVAIGEALRAVRGGWLDVAIAGGHEALLAPGILASWQAMRVLAPPPAGREGAACRPFSADRAGFALGEGSAAFIIESEAFARARGADTSLALMGYATNCDASHISNPDPGGQVRAMTAALQDAQVASSDVGYLNAHGTATTAGDAAEARSVATVFGERAVPVSSTKAIHGHLLGGGGAVELVATLRALKNGRLPPTANTGSVDPAFAIDVLGEARDAPQLRTAMSNSFAFGGTNAVLVAGLV